MKTPLVRRIKRLYQPAVVQLARLHRHRLRDTHLIGITGSCGKTSAKDFTAAVLASGLVGRKSYDTTNGIYSVARTLLATRPSHDFCVQEIGVFRPGDIERPLQLLRPTVGVITVIGSDHYSSFEGPAGIAREKRKILDVLPESGVAVLNLDDPYLREIAAETKVPVIGFGRSPEADVRATDVTAAWAEGLGFCVSAAGRTAQVRTRLLGEHQLPAVLAALAVGQAVGLPLADTVRAIESCRSPRGRMEPVKTANGITFINDSIKASYWSLEALFEFTRNARAKRKWLVIGTISDYGLKHRQLYRRVAEAALAACDQVVFIGPRAHHAAKAGERVHAFAHLRDADAFLHAELRRGDLVVLKGNTLTDHLPRLFLSHTGAVSCWREDCRRHIDCRRCRKLSPPRWRLS